MDKTKKKVTPRQTEVAKLKDNEATLQKRIRTLEGNEDVYKAEIDHLNMILAQRRNDIGTLEDDKRKLLDRLKRTS